MGQPTYRHGYVNRDSRSSGERTGNSLNLVRVSIEALRAGGYTTISPELNFWGRVTNLIDSRSRLESRTRAGDSPVGKIVQTRSIARE